MSSTKNYEFKTFNYQPYMKPMSTTQPNYNVNVQKGFNNYSTKFDQFYSSNQRNGGQVPRTNLASQNYHTNPVQPVNLSQMKKKLDLLIKQTDQFQNRKVLPPKINLNQQTYDIRPNQSERTTFPDYNNNQMRSDRLRNQKIIEQSRPTKERIYTQHNSSYFQQQQPTSTSLGKYNPTYQTKTNQNKHFGSNQPIEKYYGISNANRNSERQTDYSLSLNRDKLEDNSSFRSFNQAKRVSMASRQNPQRVSYLQSNTYESTGTRAFYSPNKQQVKKIYQPTYGNKLHNSIPEIYGSNNSKVRKQQARNPVSLTNIQISNNYLPQASNSISNRVRKQQIKAPIAPTNAIQSSNRVTQFSNYSYNKTTKQQPRTPIASLPNTEVINKVNNVPQVSSSNSYNKANRQQIKPNVAATPIIETKRTVQKTESIKPQSIKPQATKPQSVKPVSIKPDASRTDSVHAQKQIWTAQSAKLSQYELRSKNLQQENERLKQNIKFLTQSKQQYREQFSNSNKNLNKIKEEYQQKIRQLRTENSKRYDNKSEQLQALKKDLDKKIYNMQQNHFKQVQALRSQLQKKQIKIISLVKQIGNKQSIGQSVNKQQSQSATNNNLKLNHQNQQKIYQAKQLRNQINSREKTIQMLNDKIKQMRKQVQQLRKYKIESQTEKYSNFDQILMTQLQTISELKNTIEELNEKNNQLRSQTIQQSRKIDSLENEIKIIQLKHKSQLNSVRMQNQITVNDKDNMIGTLNKKMITLQQKLKLAANQIKTKDQFVKQHLVGRADSVESKEYIETVLRQYKSTFAESKQHNLIGQLQRARKQLQLYQKYV